jgi:hypothetical protein
LWGIYWPHEVPVFVKIMSCNLAVELLQKANVVITRNIVYSSKATATVPVDSNVSREVKLLHKKFHSCWGNKVIKVRLNPFAPPFRLYLVRWPRALVSKVLCVIDLIHTDHYLPLVFQVKEVVAVTMKELLKVVMTLFPS